MKAIILAAGYSLRLYPLTKNFPKGLLPVSGKAILAYTLEQLINNKNIDDIALISNDRFYVFFENWLKTNYPINKIKLLTDKTDCPENRLGALGDLLYVIDNLKWHDNLLVVSSDTLTSMKIVDFIHFFKLKNGFVNAVIDVKDKDIIKNKLGCVVLIKDRIIEFIEKPANPPSTITSIPFYIFPRKSLIHIRKYLKEGNDPDAPGSIIPWLMNKIVCYGYLVNNGCYHDVGTKEVYTKLRDQGWQ